MDSGPVSPWIKTIPMTAFTGVNSGNGYAFEIQSSAIDNTQPVDGGPNTETAYSTTTFVIDYATPTVNIQNPAHQSYFNSLSTLLGAATDYVLGNIGGGIPSGLGMIQLDLMDSDRVPSQFWNFATSAWQTAYASTTSTGARPVFRSITRRAIPTPGPWGEPAPPSF